MENVIEKYTDKDQNRRKKMLFIYKIFKNFGRIVLIL